MDINLILSTSSTPPPPSAGDEFPAPSEPYNATVSITKKQPPFLVTPLAVHMEATGLSGFSVSDAQSPIRNPAFHELVYLWEVRGRPLAPFTAPENMPSEWNNPNVMLGKQVFFYFPTPGTTYTVDLYVYDLNNGVKASATTTVTTATTAEINSRYSGTNTICLSTSGNFTNAPSGAQQITVSSTADINAVFGNSYTNSKRILFRRGETFANPSLEIGAFIEYVGVYGAGTEKATITTTTSRAGGVLWRGTHTQHTIADLNFAGPWDSTTETGIQDAKALQMRDGSLDNNYVHISRCNFSGYQSLETTPQQSTSTGNILVLTDCFVTNWRDYGCFGNNRTTDKFMGLVGCRIQQDVNALSGGIKEEPHNHHGPIRWLRIRNVIISQCDLFSRNGWAGGPNTQEQPCIRLNTSPDGNNNECIIERCVMEGGTRQINGETETDIEPEYAGNYLFDTCLLIGSAKTDGGHISMSLGGTTMRNIVGIMPNVPEGRGSHTYGIRGIGDADRFRQDNADAPVDVYNCTIVNLRSDANSTPDTFTGITNSLFTDWDAENNIVHAPSIATAITTDAPIDTSTAWPGITLRYKGIQYKGEASMDTTFASPATIPLVRPLTGSAAINDGDTGLKAYYDALGVTRPAVGNERGALLES